DLEGTVLDANAAAADLLSVQREVLIGRPLSFFIWPEDKPIYWEWLAELETAERILQWELRCNSAEVQRHVVIRARRAADGRELRWMLRDVTERIQAAETDRRLRQEHAEREENARLLDEARAASRAKSDFIGFMSHEFRTPLASIVGYADLLDHETAGPLTDAQRKQLNRLREGAWHLARLVDEILSFSREALSPPTLEMARVDLHQLGTECIQTVRPSALQCGLELNMNTAADPLIVLTDAGRVRQILINLLGNAVKFTDAGTIEMDIQRTSDGVEVRVRDTGIGIPEDQREIVFEPFRQAHGRRGGGSGLGLAVARQLALRLDGMLDVQSEVGVGTTFTLRLPLDPPTQ
ncbi:MAG: sensor histidine kinase, partial [Longimicrobiales bacterium]